MTRRMRMRNKLRHPSRRRVMWRRVKRGYLMESEWRYRRWEFRTGRLR